MNNMHPSKAWMAFATLVLCALAVVACRSAEEASLASLVTEGTANMAELVREAVPDPEREQEAQRILADYLAAEAEYFEALRAHRDALFELNANPDTARSAFDELDAGINVRRREFLDTTVEMLVALKGHLEPSEWTSVFAGMREMDEKWEDFGA